MSFGADVYGELQGLPSRRDVAETHQTSRREYEEEGRFNSILRRIDFSPLISVGKSGEVRSQVSRKALRCRNCGLSGHTRRMCPTVGFHAPYHSARSSCRNFRTCAKVEHDGLICPGLDLSARSSPTGSTYGQTGHDRRTWPFSAPHRPHNGVFSAPHSPDTATLLAPDARFTASSEGLCKREADHSLRQTIDSSLSGGGNGKDKMERPQCRSLQHDEPETLIRLIGSLTLDSH